MCGVLSHTYVGQGALYLIPVRGWLGLHRYPMALVRLLMPVGYLSRLLWVAVCAFPMIRFLRWRGYCLRRYRPLALELRVVALSLLLPPPSFLRVVLR